MRFLNTFLKKLQIKNVPLSKLDTDILRFLTSYNNTINDNPQAYPSNCYNLGYYSLVKMIAKEATPEEIANNAKMEKMLLHQIENSTTYDMRIQGSKDNPIFYHVRPYNHHLPKKEDLRRIYVNCNNGNVAELARALLINDKEHCLDLKFTANHDNSRNPRGEKIVIYCDKNDLEYIYKLLDFTRSNTPELFKESETTLPFLQNFNGFSSISKEPLSDTYITLNGDEKKSKESTNSVLSIILRESYIETVKEIAKHDRQLAFLLEEPFDEIAAIKNFPYINQNYRSLLLSGMKEKMRILSEKNDLYIDGLFSQVKPPYQKQTNEIIK